MMEKTEEREEGKGREGTNEGRGGIMKKIEERGNENRTNIATKHTKQNENKRKKNERQLRVTI